MTTGTEPSDGRPAAGGRLQGLPPVIGENTVVLVLGSFPGEASLAAGQYYAFARNHFWKILRALWPDGPGQPGPEDYAGRLAWMQSRGLGLWDVYGACERVGSLDARIRNAELNDFSILRQRCPRLQAIAHNGGESFRHARHTRALGLPVHRLPSTSPANASWSFERKLQAWREVFAQHQLIR